MSEEVLLQLHAICRIRTREPRVSAIFCGVTAAVKVRPICKIGKVHDTGFSIKSDICKDHLPLSPVSIYDLYFVDI